MANRTIQTKIVKMRRRHRKAVFSNGVVNLGVASLSHQKIGVGLRVPGRAPAKYSLNRERMAEINPRKDLITEIPKQLGLAMDKSMAMRASLALKDRDLAFNRKIYDGRKVKVYLIFDLAMKDIFLIKFDLRLDLVQTSCNFRSLEEAQDVYHRGDDRVPWFLYTVEHYSSG